MPGKKRPGADVRKKQIIDSAIEIFGEKGYKGATTAEIAENAGLSSRMVFFYFDNKKELYRNVLRLCARESMEAMMRANPPKDDIKTFFKMTTRNFQDFLKDNPLKVKIILQSVTDINDPDIREDLRVMMEGFYEYVHSFLKEAQDRGEIYEDMLIDHSTLYILGFSAIISYAEFLDLPWFGEEGSEAFVLGDHYIDAITKR